MILIDEMPNANSTDKPRLRIKSRSTRSPLDDGASEGLNLAVHKKKEEESEEKKDIPRLLYGIAAHRVWVLLKSLFFVNGVAGEFAPFSWKARPAIAFGNDESNLEFPPRACPC